MIDYQCTICLEIQKSDNVPEICNHCGSKYSDWVNLSTNETKHIEPPLKSVSPPYKPKPVPPIEPPKKTKPKTPPIVVKPVPPKPFIIKPVPPKPFIIKPVPPKPFIIKPIPPPKSPPIVISRKTGLSLSRSTFNLNVPLGNSCIETIFIRNLNKGSVSGKVMSDYSLAKPKPDSFSFNKYLFLNIHIETKTLTAPIKRLVTIRVESTSGDYDIKIILNVVETSFLGGFKYIFRPWK